MSFLTNESPSRVFGLTAVAIFTLLLMYSVAFTEVSSSSLRQVFGPAKAALALNGELLLALGNGTTEAVYATAVYTGIIPFEQSSYYAVDLPVHRPLAGPRVAGAVASTLVSENSESSVALPDVFTEAESQSPWRALYDTFRGN